VFLKEKRGRSVALPRPTPLERSGRRFRKGGLLIKEDRPAASCLSLRHHHCNLSYGSGLLSSDERIITCNFSRRHQPPHFGDERSGPPIHFPGFSSTLPSLPLDDSGVRSICFFEAFRRFQRGSFDASLGTAWRFPLVGAFLIESAAPCPFGSGRLRVPSHPMQG
jgi:hypothetical protein